MWRVCHLRLSIVAGFLCVVTAFGADEVLYEKDFRDGVAEGWQTGALSYAPDAKLREGRYELAGRGMAWYDLGASWKDYAVEFETTILKWTGDEGKRAGHQLLFRVRDDASYYSLSLSESRLVITQCGGGTTRETADLTLVKNAKGGTWLGSCERPHEVGKRYAIRIEAKGNRIAVYEDGEKVIETTLEAANVIERGSIGIGTVWAQGALHRVKVVALGETTQSAPRAAAQTPAAAPPAAVSAAKPAPAEGGGTEYFVSPDGRDSAAGTDPAFPFGTLARGAAVLKPGDTLTLLPGRYCQSLVAKLSGSDAAPITIRAARSGTVFLDGGVPLDGFAAVPGRVNVYETYLRQKPLQVLEVDSNRYLAEQPDVVGVERTPGSFFYSPRDAMLYVQASDASDPERHTLIAALLGPGISLSPADGQQSLPRIVLDGLVVQGYAEDGIKLARVQDSVVRNCRVHDCGNGIYLNTAQRTSVVDCVTYRNGINSSFDEGGNIFITGRSLAGNVGFAGNSVRGCRVYDSRHHALRCYGGGLPADQPLSGQTYRDVVVEGNLVYDNRIEGIWFKSGYLETQGSAFRNIVVGIENPNEISMLTVPNKDFNTRICTNLSEMINRYPAGPGDLELPAAKVVEARFADPVRFDYRLQSDSPWRGKGPGGKDMGALQYTPDVFFVRPDGNDSADGSSVAKAWRSLARACRGARPGDTVYVLAGTYEETLRPENSGTSDKPISFRTRGADRVILKGDAQRGRGIDLSERSFVTVEGFEVAGCREAAITIEQAEGVIVRECVLVNNPGRGALVRDSAHVRLTNNTFWMNRAGAGLLGRLPSVQVDSNLFAGNSGAVIEVDPSAREGLDCDDNAYYLSGQAALRFGDRAFRDLTAWRAATTLDLSSILRSPRLADPDAGDFRPQWGSPLIARGRYAEGIGARRPDKSARAPVICEVDKVQVFAVTPTTATITWWTPGVRSSTALRWGTTPAMTERTEVTYDQTLFHHLCLSGLKPSTTYYFQVESSAPGQFWHSSPELAAEEAARKQTVMVAATMLFSTPSTGRQERTWYVSRTGSDLANGLTPQTAWGTLLHASHQAQAGDTVIVSGGTYPGVLEPLNSGTPGKPVTFRAAEGERVIIDGGQAAVPEAACARISGVDHIALVDFDFIGGSYENGQVRLHCADNITFQRCIFDVRNWGYKKSIIIGRAKNLLFTDTVFRNITYEAFSAYDTPDSTITLRNCHLGINGICNLYVPRCAKLTMRNCLLTSIIEQKAPFLPIIYMQDPKCLDSDYNLFWFMPYDKTRMVGGEGGSKNGIWRSAEYKQKWFGLAEWQKTGQDAHSAATEEALLNRFSGYYINPFDPIHAYEDYIPALNSPAIGKGENGEDIGVRPAPWQKRRSEGIKVMVKPEATPTQAK